MAWKTVQVYVAWDETICLCVYMYAKQEHLGHKKVQGQSVYSIFLQV